MVVCQHSHDGMKCFYTFSFHKGLLVYINRHHDILLRDTSSVFPIKTNRLHILHPEGYSDVSPTRISAKEQHAVCSDAKISVTDFSAPVGSSQWELDEVFVRGAYGFFP